MQLSIKIENVYEDGEEITEHKTLDVPVPPTFVIDDEAHQDWAYDHIFTETGTGKTEGDAAYFVEVTASDEPAMMGNKYEWGI
jgi:hypothetical protein